MTQAYQGYLIVAHPFNGTIWIEKGGAHIMYATSIEDAKQIIGQLAQ